MTRSACCSSLSSWRRLVFLAAGSVEVTALTGSASDATEYSRVEGNDDENRGNDWTDDHKRDIKDDVDVSHLRQDVAVRQLSAGTMTVDYADGEGREAGEGEAGDGLGDNDSTSVWHGDDEWSS